ncbi:hypothetical protein ACFSM5_02810 [Lacibacterium aquatile]|uniref:PAS domain-containing protein n=1 Tax=Lacibacterium aquatile TaxID=1168082 RepID=A0ABW5DQJ0_9PROT
MEDPRGMDPAELTADQNGRLYSLYQHWLGARNPEGLVPKSAFDAFAIMPWLGLVSIYQRLAEDYVIRLDGTEIVRMTGEDWTGKTVAALDARYGLKLGESLAIAVEEQRAVYHPVRHLAARPHFTAARLLLPVSADGATITHVVMSLIPNEKEPASVVTPALY